MPSPTSLLLRLLPVWFLATSSGTIIAADEAPLPVRVGTSLNTDGEQLPSLALDGKAETFFSSLGGPKSGDTFTLTFSEIRKLSACKVLSGKPDGGAVIDGAVLEVSTDGQAFTEAGPVAGAEAEVKFPEQDVKVLRIKFKQRVRGGLTVREIQPGDLKLAVGGISRSTHALEGTDLKFNLVLDASSQSAEDVASLERFFPQIEKTFGKRYPDIAKTLGVNPDKLSPKVVMTCRRDMPPGVPGYAIGGNLNLSADWLLKHPEDSIGMIVHELTHTVQGYPGGSPSWIVEGIADAVRFELSPPEDAWRQRHAGLNRARSDYHRGYGEAGVFILWIRDQGTPDLLVKLNTVCRERKFSDAFFRDLTGKDLAVLWADYQAGK